MRLISLGKHMSAQEDLCSSANQCRHPCSCTVCNCACMRLVAGSEQPLVMPLSSSHQNSAAAIQRSALYTGRTSLTTREKTRLLQPGYLAALHHLKLSAPTILIIK